MFLLPAVAVVTALVVVVGLSLWLRRNLEADVQSRLARALRIKSPRLIRVLALFDGLRALSIVAIPVVALLFIATVDLTVSHRSIKQESRRSPRVDRAVGLPITGATTTSPGAAAPVPGRPRTTSPGTPSTTAPSEGALCRNSTDPACGPFRWDPPPSPNQPVKIEITHTPSAPHAGEQVTVTVHVSEADSKIGGVTVAFGDEAAVLLPPATAVACDGASPAGPWTPPPPTGDDRVGTYAHTYARPGDYRIDVYAASADFLDAKCPPSPYASQANASAPIHVG